MAQTLTQQLININERYRREVCDGENDLATVTVWAIQEGYIEDSLEDKVERWRKQLAAALRSQTFVDEKGRSVRANYSVRQVTTREDGRRVVQTVWSNIDVASHKFMEKSFEQMDDGVINAATRNFVNKAHYNEYRRGDNPEIQMNLDLTNAVADKLQSTEYQPQDLFEVFKRFDQRVCSNEFWPLGKQSHSARRASTCPLAPSRLLSRPACPARRQPDSFPLLGPVDQSSPAIPAPWTARRYVRPTDSDRGEVCLSV